MTGESGSYDENLMGEMLDTATAIADRMGKTAQVSRAIHEGVLGEVGPESLPDISRSAHLGQAALMLMKLENPSHTLTLREVIDAQLGGAGYQFFADQMSSDGKSTFDSGMVREFILGTMDAVQAKLGSNNRLSQSFDRQLAACKKIAEESGVSVADVYRDDVLYYRAVACAETPVENAEDARRIIESMSLDTIDEFCEPLINSLKPSGLLDELEPSEIEEITEEIKKEMKNDDISQQRLEEYQAKSREVFRQIFLYQFVKAYGFNTIYQLTPEQRSVVLPKGAVVEVVADAIQESM